MSTVITTLVLILVIGAFVWLTARAWRAQRAYVRWPGTILAGLLTVVFLLFAGVAAIGYAKLQGFADNPVPNLRASATAERLSRGEHLVQLCVGCHSTTGKTPLDGGRDSLLPAAMASLYPPNLTPGGPLKDWSDGDVIRAVREGVAKDGRPLMIMPAETFHQMSDADVQSVVAYLRSQPASAHEPPSRSFTPLGAALLGAGKLRTSVQPPIRQPVLAPDTGATVAYGKYLVDISGCRTCHGSELTGGTSSLVPKGPNLRFLVPPWTEAQFVQTIRTGKDPSGHSLDPDMMPWKDLSAAYSDEELRGVSTYLHSLPPR